MSFFRKFKDFILGEVCMQGIVHQQSIPPPLRTRLTPPTLIHLASTPEPAHAAQDLMADGNEPGRQKANVGHQDSQPHPGSSHTAPRQAAPAAAAQAQVPPARPAPAPLLQDAHPVTGGGIQARGRPHGSLYRRLCLSADL